MHLESVFLASKALAWYYLFQIGGNIMCQFTPDYYKDFHCIAGNCRHSCCIGWEIDVDPDKLCYYNSVPGPFGDRLRANISLEDPPHFILGAGERCPFLNRENLCDIILTLGEDQICEICSEHPRFHNHLSGRIESGLGLCCEEAARLILSRTDPVRLVFDGSKEEPDELISLRDKAMALLQDRSHTLQERLDAMLTLCDAALPKRAMEDWCSFLLSLERLDEAWTDLLDLMQTEWNKANLSGFDVHMHSRQTEYEQFAVYLLYRHLSQAVSPIDLSARAAFVAWSYHLLRALGAVLWTKNGSFTFENQVELVRLFSSELEYSEENMDLLLDELC